MYALGHRKFETLKHNSTSANLIPVGITYTNHMSLILLYLIQKTYLNTVTSPLAHGAKIPYIKTLPRTQITSPLAHGAKIPYTQNLT